MITLYSGTPGSGKSYHAITLMIKILKSGRQVIANFPMKFKSTEKFAKNFTYVSNKDLTVEYLLKFSLQKGLIDKKKESQCLVVIDEAGGKFNCRTFSSTDRYGWIEFFSQHRKLGFDFILVAQNDRMLDKQIRQLAEYEKIHRKINRIGIFEYLPISIFVAVEQWYVIKQRLSCEFIFFRKSIADRYDSMKLFDELKINDNLLKKMSLGEKVIDSDFKKSVEVIYTSEKEVS